MTKKLPFPLFSLLLLSLLCTGVFQVKVSAQNVLDSVVMKKPLLEVLTSSSCPPCSAANHDIDSILQNNAGSFSLIKYQMSWPAPGDPYYIMQAGQRQLFYNVNSIPDMFNNGANLSPFSFSQAELNNLLTQQTSIGISLNAQIDVANQLSISGDVMPYAAYPAGLSLYVVVVEKTTVGNTSTNGETYFSHVMMQMFPDSDGETLGSLVSGAPVPFNYTHNMSSTFMEQPTDLAVVAFIQDNATKEVLQSEMVDVISAIPSFTVTFNVQDAQGNPIQGANIFLENYGPAQSGANGMATYSGVLPAALHYDIVKTGLLPDSGTVVITNQNVIVTSILASPNLLFYEDFEGGSIPSAWTKYSTTPDFLYWYSGHVIFFRQSSTANNLMLVSPYIPLYSAGMLRVDAGNATGSPVLQIGTLNDPLQPSGFNMLQSYTISGSSMQEYTYDFNNYNGSDNYIAFKAVASNMEYFSLDNIRVEYGTAGIKEDESHFSYYPNPADDYLMISHDGKFSMNLFDLSGRLLFSTTSESAGYRLSLHDYSSGCYFLELSGQKTTKRVKLIINH